MAERYVEGDIKFAVISVICFNADMLRFKFLNFLSFLFDKDMQIS